MTLTIPIVLVYVFAGCICYRYMGLRLWHLLVCLLLGFLLTSAAPEIQNLLNTLIHGGHK